MSGKQRKGKALSLWYNEKMRLHTHEWPHIEKCTRAEHAFDYLSKVGLIEQCNVLNGRKATDAELLTVHTAEHLSNVTAATALVACTTRPRRMLLPAWLAAV